MNKTVYLAHGFEECQRLGKEFQAAAEALGVRVLNPFDRPEQPLYNKMVVEGVDFDKEVSQKIVEMDLRLINQAEAMVAIPGKTSIGTHMEIFYASRILRLPVFLLWIHQSTYKHPWLNYLTNYYTTMGPLWEDFEAWARMTPAT